MYLAGLLELFHFKDNGNNNNYNNNNDNNNNNNTTLLNKGNTKIN